MIHAQLTKEESDDVKMAWDALSGRFHEMPKEIVDEIMSASDNDKIRYLLGLLGKHVEEDPMDESYGQIVSVPGSSLL